jgi:hypothetical protein
MQTAWEFLCAIVKDWVARMSGIASLVLALVAGLGHVNYPWAWWLASYLCLLVAAFQVWKAEWQKPGPKVIVKYGTENKIRQNDLSWEQFRRLLNSSDSKNQNPALTIQNLSDIIAINVKIDDVSVGKKTIRFPAISVIKQKASVKPQEVIDGRHNLVECLDAELAITQKEFLLIPVTVSYSDTCGRNFETTCEIRYGRLVVDTFIKKFRRTGNRPSWFIRQNKKK